MSGTTPRRVRKRLFLITMVVMLGLVTHSTHIGTGDEPHYLAIAHSLAFDLDLDLSNNYGAAEPLIFNGGNEAGAHVVPGIGGIARPVHDVGMPMLFAPYVRFAATGVSLALPHIPDNAMKRMRLTPWTLYRNVLSAAMIGLAGLLAIQLFSVFLAIDVPLKRAFRSTLLVVLSPPILIFGALFFTELVTALLCVFVFRVVAVERTASAREWVLAGVATGLMVIVHARNLGLVLPLIAVAMWSVTQSRDFRKLALFAAPAVVLLGVRTAINYQFWGTYVVGPHARVGEWAGLGAFLETFGVRIAGLFVDQEYGLLPYAPVFVLCAYGVVALRRSHPDASDEDCVHRRLLPFRHRHADHQRARMDGRVVTAGSPAASNRAAAGGGRGRRNATRSSRAARWCRCAAGIRERVFLAEPEEPLERR